MATYSELYDIATNNNGSLLNRITTACVIAAEAIRVESGATTNHANRLLWAKFVLQQPRMQAEKMIWAILAQNASATVAQINAATDATIQTAVGNAVDVLANGS